MDSAGRNRRVNEKAKFERKQRRAYLKGRTSARPSPIENPDTQPLGTGRQASAPAPEINRESIGLDAPLRLTDAAKLAFPAGGMTASGLRSEAKRGHLKIERIANKDFTTLRAIEEMRQECRVEVRDRISGFEKSVGEMANSLPEQAGSLSITENISPQVLLCCRK